MQQIISLLLENKPGALMRVTGLIGQRGYNIESLTVARTLDATLSRMTIVVDVEAAIRAQVIKQMNKLINVDRPARIQHREPDSRSHVRCYAVTDDHCGGCRGRHPRASDQADE